MIDDDELNAERELSKVRCPELWAKQLLEERDEARLALWMVARALCNAYPTEAPWRDGWCHDTTLTRTISLMVSDIRAVLEESGYMEHLCQTSGK